MHVFLNQSLIQANHSLEQLDSLVAVVDLSCSELVDRGVVSLELACLEEGDRILYQCHRGQLRQILVVVKLLLTGLNVSFELSDAPLHLVFGHEDRAKHELVILQVVQLFKVIDSLGMASISSFFKLGSLFDRFKNSIDFKDLVLEPHLDMNERIGHHARQIVIILFQLLILCVLEEKLLLRKLALLRQVLLAAKIGVDLGAVSHDRVQLVVVEELVKAAGTRIVLLVLLVHDRDVIDELGQERLHALHSARKLHYLVEGTTNLLLFHSTVDLEVALESLERGCRVEVFGVQPVQLLINILLRENEDLEFFRLDEIWALGHLLDEHAQQVAALTQELITVVTEALLLRQGRDVEAGQALYKAVAKGEEVLVSALDLVRLHRGWVDAINHEYEMVAIFDIADHIEVPCELVTVQISTDCDELALPDVLGFFEQSAGVLFALLLELFVFGVTLRRGHHVRAIALLRLR